MKELIAGLLANSSKLKKNEILNLIEIAKDSSLGDYAFPCFVLAKKFKKSPAEIAKEISKKLEDNPNLEKVEAVGPYVNFFLNRKILAKEILDKVQSEKDRYGSSKAAKEKIMIEFSQANT